MSSNEEGIRDNKRLIKKRVFKAVEVRLRPLEQRIFIRESNIHSIDVCMAQKYDLFHQQTAFFSQQNEHRKHLLMAETRDVPTQFSSSR